MGDQWYSRGGPKRACLIWARVPKLAENQYSAVAWLKINIFDSTFD